MAKVSGINIKLIDSAKSVTSKILKAIVGKLNRAVSSSKASILSDLKTQVVEWLNDEQVIRDLRGSGSLNAEIGLPAGHAASAADLIVNAVVESMDINFKQFNERMAGGMSIGIQPLDFQNLLNIGKATILTEKGQQLNWLEWLLKSGSRIIVRDYSIEYGRYAKRSRSGEGAIMVERKSGGWRMPAQYAGVEENNFITRAFEGRESEISKIISKRITSKI
jgi:hypothetical protein